jgi:hypothetical protein
MATQRLGPSSLPALMQVRGLVGLIIKLRKDLAGQGLDASPQTIARHLRHHPDTSGPNRERTATHSLPAPASE